MRITRRYGAMATLAGAAEFSLGSHALSPQLAGRTAAEQSSKGMISDTLREINCK